MNSSAQAPPNGWTSFALGLLTAASSVLVSQGLWLFAPATDRGGFIVERFFSPTLYGVVVTFVTSLVVSLGIILSRRRRGRWMGISVGKTFSWAIASTLVLNLVPIMTFALPEFGGMYFSFAVFSIGIISTVLALPLAVALTAISIRQYRRRWQPIAVQPQLD